MRDRICEVRAASDLRCAVRSRREGVAELFETLCVHHLGGCGCAALCRDGARGDKQKSDDTSIGHHGSLTVRDRVSICARLACRAPCHLNGTSRQTTAIAVMARQLARS